MIRLKADLHTHSADDPFDDIPYSSEMLIDIVAARGYQVLAITGHRRLVFYPQTAEYARQRGVVLIPGVELVIEGKHVLILNPDAEQAAVMTFADLKALGRRDAVVIAPHPYYPGGSSLGDELVEHIDLFDAVEYCCLYYRALNPNKKAVRVANAHGLPLIGTSDTHTLPYLDRTFTWIEAEEVSAAGVIDAIRRGRVTLATRPSSIRLGIKMCCYLAKKYLRELVGLSE